MIEMTTVKKTGSGRYYACNKKYSIRKKQSTHYGWYLSCGDRQISEAKTVNGIERQIRFIEGCERVIRHMGATQETGEYKWELETDLGKLTIALYGNWVAMRFKGDLEKPKKVLGDQLFDNPFSFNPLSGKWNFVPGDISNIYGVLDQFIQHLCPAITFVGDVGKIVRL